MASLQMGKLPGWGQLVIFAVISAAGIGAYYYLYEWPEREKLQVRQAELATIQTRIATGLVPRDLRLAFAGFLMLLAAIIAWRTLRNTAETPRRPPLAWGWSAVLGLAGGVVSGLFGVGGAFIAPPVLRARKALAGMVAGEVLRVLADDAMAAIDLPHFCAEAGHEHLGMTMADGAQAHLIRRG